MYSRKWPIKIWLRVLNLVNVARRPVNRGLMEKSITVAKR
jgi:hypothetical protein